MKKIFTILLIMFSFFSKGSANYDELAYNFKFNKIDGGEINLNDFREKVIVIVNVASRCGFTGQYEGLQALWSKYRDKDLIVIGVPTNNFRQEPGSNSEIKDFCETNFGVNFIMTEKTSVLGVNAHPFYKWARINFGNSAVPKWNFHKIIINKKGKVSQTYSSITKPASSKFINLIEKEIKN